MKKLILFPFLLTAFSISAQQLAATYHTGQKVFVENKGQVVDEHGTPNHTVKFLYHDGLFNLELKENGFSYEIFEVQQEGNNIYESGRSGDENAPDGERKITSHRIDVTFKGANRNVIAEPSDPIEGYFNFIYAPVTASQQLHISGFRKITYPGLYSGIDLVFYTPDDSKNLPSKKNSETSLRYEFIVHPGADISKIKFEYTGATDVSLTSSGDFLLNTSGGFIKETKPEYFIEGNKQPLNAGFVFSKNIKSFSACKYDHTKFLIIDPDMIWGTYFGGEKVDEIEEVAIGPDLMPVLDGRTVSFLHIASSGAYQQVYGGGVYDWFITKFNSDGTLYWSTYFGGTDRDYCYSLAVDNNNNIIAAGNTQSQGMATPGAFKTTISGTAADVLIAKFSPYGNLIWSTYFGSDSSEEVRNVVTDAAGNLYLGGTTKSTTGIASPGAYQNFNGGYDDALILKFTADGNRVWSTYYGDSGVDRIHAVSLDLYGHLYVAGTTSSTKGIASPDGHQTVYGGGSEDAMLAKFDTSGNFEWGTYYGGSEDDRSRGVETDSAGNVYLGGYTNSSDSIGTPGAYQSEITFGILDGVPTDDAFLAKFSSDGIRQWGTYIGGSHSESLWGITIDKSINALYVVGETNSTENIAYGNAIQPVKSLGNDCLFAKFFTDGFPQWSTYFGGTKGDQFEDAAVDQNHFLYLVANASGPDMPSSPHVFQKAYYGGDADAMMYKFYGGNNCYDQFEPNESLAAAKTIYPYRDDFADTSVYGYNANISNATDQDWYQFSISDSAPNLMTIISLYKVDLNLNLYNDQGILIYQSSHTDSIPDTIAVNELTAGTYYLEVPHSPADFDSLHCYRLQILISNLPFPLVGIPTGIHGTIASGKFLVYPDPVHDQLSFFIPSSGNQTATVTITDMLSRVVFFSQLKSDATGRRFYIPSKDFSAGPYSVIVRMNDEILAGKFVKE